MTASPERRAARTATDLAGAAAANTFIELPGFVGHLTTIVKLEGLNPAGSIKLKAATAMVDKLEADGRLRPGSSMIESSSGNLGVALAVVGAARGYCVTIVTDPNVNRSTRRIITALGAELVTISDRDANGGYLGSRLDYIRARLATDPTLVWPNQYDNAANVRAHRETTAEEILGLGDTDWVFVGAGTTGTLMGCADRFRGLGGRITLVGVDAEGSVTFGGTPARRLIPGIGTSRVPEIFDEVSDFLPVVISERDTIRTCREVARRYGLLLGGSSGSVLAAVVALGQSIPPGSHVVAVSADMGERYLDTIYDDDWVERHFGRDVLSADNARGELHSV